MRFIETPKTSASYYACERTEVRARKGAEMKVTKRLAAVALVLFAGYFLAACGGGSSEKTAEKIIEASGGGEVDVDINKDGSFTMQSKDGSGFSVGGSTELPPNFPSSVPTPSGTLNSSFYDGVGDFTLGYDVSDFKSTMSSYSDKLKSSGFEVESEFTSADTISRSWANTEYTVTAIGAKGTGSGNDTLSVVVSKK